MLETEIKNNTAALSALAAAVAELTAALRVQNPAAAPAPASMPPAAAAPVAPAPAPASMPPVNPVPAAAAPVAPAPASMPPVNPVPAAAAPAAPVPAPAPAPAPAISGDDLRKLCVKAGAAGLTAEVVQFLSDHGVTKLAALPPADYPALVALLKSKGVE